ncbi:hypothetical protein CPB84DRAFT_1789272 [Gymnopilus junonius]|uniref:Uncharacterized protein n=1 Tax=Gymnopilus junonius TaxID=109634 RepID=A0A9P5NEX0_GYMJU|nr:hypothetical protein CPB84DRAFT_1789272 [Gymnopilus junonius]
MALLFFWVMTEWREVTCFDILSKSGFRYSSHPHIHGTLIPKEVSSCFFLEVFHISSEGISGLAINFLHEIITNLLLHDAYDNLVSEDIIFGGLAMSGCGIWKEVHLKARVFVQ